MHAFLVSSADTHMSTSEPLLLFVHIPKTAGTTVRQVLSMNEPGPRSRAIGNVFKGGGGISKSVVSNVRSGRVADFARVRLVRGHVPFGLAEYLERTLPEDREVQSFTFLREPVDRMLSHFFAIRESGRA